MISNTVYSSQIDKIKGQATKVRRDEVKQITASDSFNAMTNDKNASVGRRS
jgi:hypothetical protein